MKMHTQDGVTLKFNIKVEISRERAIKELEENNLPITEKNIKILQDYVENKYEIDETILHSIIDGDGLEMSAFEVAFEFAEGFED